MAQGKGNFVDFILETLKNRDLGMKFMQITEVEDLKRFFDEEEFHGISEEDPPKILEAKKNLENMFKGRLGDSGDDYY